MMDRSEQPRQSAHRSALPLNVVKPDFENKLRVVAPMDLSRPESQQLAAEHLERLLKTRKSSDRTCGEFLREIEGAMESQGASAHVPVARRFQLAVFGCLSVMDCSGIAENILLKIATSPESLHPDLMPKLAQLTQGASTHYSGRSLAVALAGIASPPPELFIGPSGTLIFSAVGTLNQSKLGMDCSEMIDACKKFCARRLAFVSQATDRIPERERAAAFAETVMFLLKDLERKEGRRFESAVKILDTHKLQDVVCDEVSRLATSLWAQVKKFRFKKSEPLVRTAQLLPEVNKELLSSALQAAFTSRLGGAS